MRHYRYEHKRTDAQGNVIGYDTGNIAGDTLTAVQETLMGRFGLEYWEDWTCLANGSSQRIHPWHVDRPYRGIIIVRPIHGKTEA